MKAVVAVSIVLAATVSVVAIESISEAELLRSFETGYSYVDKLDQIESELLANDVYIGEDSPFYKMAQFKRAAPKSREISRQALQVLETTRALQQQLGVSSLDLMSLRASTNFSVISATCQKASTCYNSKYRTYDGSCNNLVTPVLGKAFTVYRRVLPASYSDGIQTPRLAKNGTPLKSTRNISMTIFNGKSKPNLNATLAVMQFGQFINHDMESTGQFSFGNGTDIMCCSSTNAMLPAAQLHPACLPIEVSIFDRFYVAKQVNRTCMNFVRTVAGLRNNCSLGYADQLNQITHWLDASTVYGSDNVTAASLRSFIGGQLKTSNLTGRPLLPISSSCTNEACFFAGDSRATEQPQLTVMHTLWMREHNRIAKQLATLNPTWTDEIIFQEARRILVAELQHITYTEWLPTLLNSTYLSSYGLQSSAPNFFTGYTSTQTDGPITNEFATAAFRMGHSMVQGFIRLLDQNGAQMPTSYKMSRFFNNARILNQVGVLDGAIRSLITQPLDAVDNQVSDELWNLLFKGNLTYGFDIVALNAQRGRDHGLPAYNKYRQICGLKKLINFSDLAAEGLTNQMIKRLTGSYASVDDIDLYVGGLLEVAVTGGNLGPTFSCLIAENFSQLKKSDRFFYEVSGQRHSFTSAQLTEIRKASMARIFCDNNDGTVTSIQPKAFLPATGTNSPVLCSSTSIPSLELSLWENEKL